MNQMRFRLAGAICAAVLMGVVTGCNSSEDSSAVRDEVKKNTATTAASGSSPYGKMSTEAKMPPPGKPPEPGADMSQRGKAAVPAKP